MFFDTNTQIIIIHATDVSNFNIWMASTTAKIASNMYVGREVNSKILPKLGLLTCHSRKISSVGSYFVSNRDMTHVYCKILTTIVTYLTFPTNLYLWTLQPIIIFRIFSSDQYLTNCKRTTVQIQKT